MLPALTGTIWGKPESKKSNGLYVDQILELKLIYDLTIPDIK